MRFLEYDRPLLQAPGIYMYVPYKDTVTCRNRAWTGPLPIAAGTIPTRYGIFIPAELLNAILKAVKTT